MNNDNAYVSIAVVDPSLQEKIAIEVISITPDSCDLSGAWLLNSNEVETFHQIAEGRALILVGKGTPELMEVFESYVVLNLDDFLLNSANDARDALIKFDEFVVANEEEYKKYMEISVAERKSMPKLVKKKLTQPSFFDWPSEINLNKSDEVLSEMGKLSKIEGTPPEMQRVLTASRLLQILINMWRSDEIERANRVYVSGDAATVSILPNIWMEALGQSR
jgi:hypothetical protein